MTDGQFTVSELVAINQANAAARSDAVASAIRKVTPGASTLTAMDYGCGLGQVGLQLVDHFAHIILADPDLDALSQAATASSGMPGISIMPLDLSVGSPPPDLRVDVILSCLSWHHVLNLDTLLETLPSVSPGGQLLVAEMDFDGGAYHAELPDFKGVDGFDRGELKGRLHRHGYLKVSVADLWQGQKWVAGKLTAMSLFLLQARIPTPATQR